MYQFILIAARRIPAWLDRDMSSVDPFQPNGQFCPKAEPVKINVINVDKVINEWTPCPGHFQPEHVDHLL